MSAGRLFRWIDLRSLAAAALLLFIGSPAAATSVPGSAACGSPCHGPGFALSDLVSGKIDSFDSRNLALTFSNFSLDFSGEDEPNLSGYRVLPVSNGFMLFSFDKFSGHWNRRGRSGSDFELQYDVTADDGLTIAAVHLGLLGGRGASVSMDVFDSDSEDLLAELHLDGGSQKPGFCWPGHGRHNKRWDSAELDELAQSLFVSEQIRALTGGQPGHYFHDSNGGNWLVAHRFTTAAIVPEPATALMLGAGLLGLGVAGRRRF